MYKLYPIFSVPSRAQKAGSLEQSNWNNFNLTIHKLFTNDGRVRLGFSVIVAFGSCAYFD